MTTITARPGLTTIVATLPIAVASAALTVAPAAGPSAAAESGAASTAAASATAAPGRRPGPLTGQWRMTSLEVRVPGAFERTPYSGQLLFTPAGTLAVQAMNPDPNAADTPFTVDGYEAYYGPVTVNQKKGTFTIKVVSAAVRDLIGQRLTRNYEVSRRQLVVTPSDPSEGFRVTYHRVR